MKGLKVKAVTMRQSIVVFLAEEENNFILSNNRSNKKGNFVLKNCLLLFPRRHRAARNGSSTDLADKCGLTFRLSVSLGFEQITIG